MTSDDPKIVRKSVFASMCGVTPARVSQWLSEGKLTGEALVGEGRSAKINVAIALGQLRARLDVSQRFGIGTFLHAATHVDPSTEGAGGQELSGDQKENQQLISTKTTSERLKVELLTLRLARSRRELLSRQACLDVAEAAGLRISRLIESVPDWAEEIDGIARSGGPKLIAVLLRKNVDALLLQIADELSKGNIDDF
jgi:hypothetical protein